MPKVVGIDLGTTNSVVAVMEGQEPSVITLAEGSRLCPSVVGFSRSGERLVGQLAKRQAVSLPDRTISSIKRQMGKDCRISVDGKFYTPQEISAMILQKLKRDAESYLGMPVTQAVITVPAYFSDAQRQATKDAGAIAGLEVLRIINEPTAAALAYGIDKEDLHTVLVWDLGGGTFDVSILELDNGVFEVRATCGDTQLGGDDWDARLVEWMAARFREEHGIDLRRDRTALQRLKEAAEKAKIELSSMVQTSVSLPFLSSGPDGPLHLDVDVSRAQFQAMTSDLRDRMIKPTRQALSDAGLEPSDIDKVLLVGGSTRMPAVQELVRQLFGKEPHRGVDPDLVVAAGAAIQAGVLAGEVQDVILLDVTPLSLGIETLGGVMTRLIERNTTIPTSKTEVFTTASNGQTVVDIKVYQGEREIAAYNKLLANFHLTGIPPAPRGVPKIEVTFDIDVNGIVHVSARDTQTGNQQRVTITDSTGLSPEEIARMIREAEAAAAEDHRARELREARSRAEAAIEEAEQALAQAGPASESQRGEAVRQAAAALREAMEGGDPAAMRQGLERLVHAQILLAGAAYASQAEEGVIDHEAVVREAVDEVAGRGRPE